MMTNSSPAAIQLGIIGMDADPVDVNDVPDGKIIGEPIAGASLLDRFFISAPGAEVGSELRAGPAEAIQGGEGPA